MFSKSIEQSIRDHAQQSYPNECCGVVSNDAYIPLDNISLTPGLHFEIDSGKYLELQQQAPIQAIIHSHTNGNPNPSEADIQVQISSGVPWGIVVTDGHNTKAPFYFGDGVPIGPLVGRTYQHGVTDCLILIRDYYRLEKNIILSDYARGDNWWNQNENLYLENYQSAGFKLIDAKDIQIGDVFLAQVRSDLNYLGVSDCFAVLRLRFQQLIS